MKQYHDLLQDILDNGIESEDRTGVGTLSVFGRMMRFDLCEGFPILTTKKIHFKSVLHELIWLVSGSTNTKYLDDNGVRIWREWSDSKGNLGPVYGHQLRNLNATPFDNNNLLKNSKYYKPYFKNGYDQLAETIKNIKDNPYSRRHVVSLWNSSDLKYQALPCCHGTVIQFYVRDKKISCSMYQRSCDTFLGLGFNISSYAILTHMIAQVCGLDVGELIITTGDTHIYKNHIEQVKLQLTREEYPLPTLWLNPEIKDIDDFTYEDIKLIGYKSHPSIKADVAV